MTDEKKINYASAALSGLIGGCLTAWEASYAFFWLFGTWLPLWPALVVIVVWAALLTSTITTYNERGKPVATTMYLFSSLIWLTWFALWLATFSPLHFPLVK